MEIASTERRSIYCGHTENLLAFYKQKIMRSYHPLHFNPVTLCESKKEYVGRIKISQVNCLCPDCENIELLCTGINKCCESMNFPTNCHHLALMIACDPITEKCVTKEWTLPKFRLGGSSGLFWSLFLSWKKGEKYYKKQLTENTGEEVMELLNEQIDYVKVYYYQKRI